MLRNYDDLILEENILILGKMLEEKRNGKNTRIKYNSINEPEIKKLTKVIKDYLFKDKESSLYKTENEFKESLNKINDYFYWLNKKNHINGQKKKSDYSKTKEEYINNYIYNAIVNHASYKYHLLKKDKQYLNSNDIIQEAILKMYKRNKKQSRYDLLVNYLSNINQKNQSIVITLSQLKILIMKWKKQLVSLVNYLKMIIQIIGRRILINGKWVSKSKDCFKW